MKHLHKLKEKVLFHPLESIARLVLFGSILGWIVLGVGYTIQHPSNLMGVISALVGMPFSVAFYLILIAVPAVLSAYNIVYLFVSMRSDEHRKAGKAVEYTTVIFGLFCTALCAISTTAMATPLQSTSKRPWRRM